jgi:hypothetical protein
MTGCVGSSGAPVPPAGPSAENVVERLRAAGAQVTNQKVYTAADDPNQLLGKPSQYRERLTFQDGAAGNAFVTIEIFATDADRQARETFLQSVTAKSTSVTEYAWGKGTVLVRLDKAFPPDRAKQYLDVVAALP